MSGDQTGYSNGLAFEWGLSTTHLHVPVFRNTMASPRGAPRYMCSPWHLVFDGKWGSGARWGTGVLSLQPYWIGTEKVEVYTVQGSSTNAVGNLRSPSLAHIKRCLVPTEEKLSCVEFISYVFKQWQMRCILPPPPADTRPYRHHGDLETWDTCLLTLSGDEWKISQTPDIKHM